MDQRPRDRPEPGGFHAPERRRPVRLLLAPGARLDRLTERPHSAAELERSILGAVAKLLTPEVVSYAAEQAFQLVEAGVDQPARWIWTSYVP